MTARTTNRDWLLFGLLSLFWGSSYLFIKIGVQTLQPFTLIALRLFFGTLILAVALRLSRATIPRDRATYGKFLFMALFSIVIPFSLITWGEQWIESSLATILQATTPLVTIVIASFVLAEEAITVNRLVGLIIGFGGVIVLIDNGLTGGGGNSFLGEAAILGSSVSYAVGGVFVRARVRGHHPNVPAFFQVAIALVIVSVLALVFESPIQLPTTGQAWFAVLWLGVFGSSLAYLIYFRLIHVMGPTRVSLITYVMPIVGIVLGFLVLGERLDLQTFIGAAIILGGVGLVNSRRSSRRIFGRDPGLGFQGEQDRPDHDDRRGGQPTKAGPAGGRFAEAE